MKYYERYLDRDIPEEHSIYFRRMFGLSDVDSLPPALINEYWRVKEVYDKTNLNIGIRDLALILLLSREDHEAPKQPTLGERFNNREIRPMARVVVKHRDQWHVGRFVDANTRDKTVRVIVDGEGHPRTFPDNRNFVMLESEFKALENKRKRQEAKEKEEVEVQ
ncbi:MAG: hypothetical protein KatS3mg087_1026 [Patescibacteria group bacterium]|nr:MAG: hypothetical protein KatS3mg087_1026 [Patescibacteria group bacterium]